MTVTDHLAQIVETQLLWRSEEETAACAQALAVQPALRNALMALHGDLGAGKTTWVRHLLRALGVGGRIKSPSYALVEPHQATDLNIWHFDFYRFNDPREWEEAGLRDLFASPGLKLVEWPNKALWLPQPDLDIYLDVDAQEQRHVRLRASTGTGRSLLDSLVARPAPQFTLQGTA